MKNLKVTLVTTLLIASSAFCQAQDAANASDNKDRAEGLKAKLELSDEQTAQMKAINASYEEKNKALKAKIQESKKAIKLAKTELKASRGAQVAEMEKVLNEKQLAEFKKIQAARKEKKEAKMK